MLTHPTECPTDWAMATYDCKNRDIAAVIASQNLRKLNVSLIDMMNQTQGLTDEDDIKDLARLRKCKRPIAADVFIRNEDGELKVNKSSNDWIEVDDNQSQIKTLELCLKLKGKLKEDSKGNGNGHGETTIIIIRDGKETSNLSVETERKNLCIDTPTR